jgi:uridine kinase
VSGAVEQAAGVHRDSCACVSPEMHAFALRVGYALRCGDAARPGSVLGIDGPSGAGKTVLAECVAAASGADVFHMDDVYPGWTGLEQGARYLVDWVLHPLSQGRPAVWRRYDWHAGEFAETHSLAPGGLLVVEGVGSYSRRSAPYLDSTIWVEAPARQRRKRVESRDGATTARTWELWARQERAFHREHGARGAAGILFRNQDP